MNILGRICTDRITGLSGICTGVVYYLTGCNQALIAPRVSADGSPRESHWLDLQRLDIDWQTPPLTLDNGVTPGADKAAPKR